MWLQLESFLVSADEATRCGIVDGAEVLPGARVPASLKATNVVVRANVSREELSQHLAFLADAVSRGDAGVIELADGD